VPLAAHVVTRLNVGGIARFLGAARGAVDVLVRGRAEPGETEARWEGAQFRVPSLRRALRPADDLRAFLDLVRLLDRLGPRVVHTHASKAGALGRAAARFLGIPWVHTFHGHVLDGYFPRPLQWLFRGAERVLARGGTVTATGPSTACELERMLGAPVGVVPPGVALPEAAPDARERWRASWGEPALVALAVARRAPVKDLDRFVRASRAAGFLPVVAGARSVPGALALGGVERMEEIYAACDVVVCSSRREGTPYSLLEAAWCGRPVVATPVGDVPWIVGEGGVVGGDLALGLRRLRDAGERERMGRAAARDVRLRFPADRPVETLLGIYRNSLQDSQIARRGPTVSI
jgi:glycosyltransferase involved in cell wall biosynthesis